MKLKTLILQRFLSISSKSPSSAAAAASVVPSKEKALEESVSTVSNQSNTDSEPETLKHYKPPPFPNDTRPETGEVGGPKGKEPTRYGDWERNGRVIDF